jgi:hypothetical protein
MLLRLIRIVLDSSHAATQDDPMMSVNDRDHSWRASSIASTIL